MIPARCHGRHAVTFELSTDVVMNSFSSGVACFVFASSDVRFFLRACNSRKCVEKTLIMWLANGTVQAVAEVRAGQQHDSLR